MTLHEAVDFFNEDEINEKKPQKQIMEKDSFGITDGKKCEDICKYAPPENKWPCVDCDMRCHDRAEPKEVVK